MNTRRSTLALVGTVAAAIGAAAGARTAEPARTGSREELHFVAHVIDSGLTGGYQVVAVDLNRDARTDIIALAAGMHELVWYENPGWQRHVIVSGIDTPINAAAYDIDGDGVPEIALAHGFDIEYAKSAGIVSILTHRGDPALPWTAKEIDRLPTSHRLRFADIDGSGKKVLVNFPLIGAHATAPLYRDHVPLVMYRSGDWKRESISDDDSGVVHGVLITPWHGDRRESLLSASFTGVHLLRYDKGRWTRTKVVAGDPSAWPKSGASDVVVGRAGSARFLATIEPWHGNEIVVYRQAGGGWTRHVIDSTLTDGHAILVGDLGGDGRDEIVAGEREGKRGIYVYRWAEGSNERWTRQTLAEGDGAAGCATADLNGDGRLDVVCISTATGKLTWFENRP